MTSRRSGKWLADPGFGVYVHIPFCLHRCHYCDFNTYEGLEALREPYVDAVVTDIERTGGEHPRATSLFIGGGTPTLLPPESLGRIVRAVAARIGIEPGAEITVEANPETVDERAFAGLLEQGIGRFSIGVQSLNPSVLEALGRTHSAGRALGAITAARAAGVDDLNIDLIYGSPWERAEDWVETLEGAIEAGPDHLSCYALTVESGTPLATMVATGRTPDVDPDVQADRFEVATACLRTAGYERYEVSNWARPGRASAHNVLYWSAGDYLGFGAGAHGHLSGRRYWMKRLPREFIDSVAQGSATEEGAETLELDRRAGEALALGLRLASGVDLASFAERFGRNALELRAPAFERLETSGLIESVDGWTRATERGTFLGNEIATALL